MSVGKNKLIPIIFLVIVMSLSIVPPVITSSSDNQPSSWITKIDPILMNKDYYTLDFTAKIIGSTLEVSQDKLPVFNLKYIREGQAKIAIIANPETNIKLIEKNVEGIIFAYKLPSFLYVEAWATYNDVINLAKKPFTIKIVAMRSPISTLLSENNIKKNEIAEPLLHAAVGVIGASKVWKEYNITGKGVKVAVVDTGIDFGLSDFGVDAIARDENGLPMIFDADEVGLVLTINSVVANSSGYINLNEPVMFFDWYTMTIGQTYYGWVQYVGPYGVYVDVFPLTTFYVGNIHSYNNTFKFGIAVQTIYLSYGIYGLLQYTVPVILADTNDDGYYDTVYADLSTTYYYIVSVLNSVGLSRVSPDQSWRDFSFADEPAATYGSEILARDFTGDGINDFSAGTLSGYMYDWLGIFTGQFISFGWDKFWEYGGVILPGLDPHGYYVSIMYDWLGHGTSCAGVIGSRGKVVYNLGYGNYTLKGIAPDAKLASMPGYLINPFTAEFFFSGYDPVNEPWNWTYTGKHKTDIISNSWGVSYIALAGFASGLDPWSLIEDYLTSSSGTVIVHAMGNGGPGYGTVTMPGSGSLIISVGASTLFEYLRLYGRLPGPGGEVVSWSDRGPTNLGTVKPDVVNIGSFAWAPAPWHFGFGNGKYAYDLFGGTSEATPMTSGSVALLIQAYYEKYGEKPTPGVVKTLLKSTARDLGYDPFTQGSGHVDIYEAVKTIMKGGVPRVYTYDTFNEVYSIVDNEALSYNMTPVEDTQIYTGPMSPGESKEFKLYIEGNGSYELKAITFKTVRENLIKYLDLDKAIVLTPNGEIPLKNIVVNVTGDTLYLNISFPTISHILIPVSEDAYKDADLVTFIASYPYEIFDPQGRNGIYRSPFSLSPWLYAGIDLHYWIDLDGGNNISLAETVRINYDIRAANNFHVTFGKPCEKIKMYEERVRDYLGSIPANAERSVLLDIRIYHNAYYYINGYVVVPFKLEIEKTYRVDWSWIKVSSVSSGKAGVEVTVPEDAYPGVYEGYIIVSGGEKDVLVPVSVVVKSTIDKNTKALLLTSKSEEHPYRNYFVEGQFDWTWRYESGDWRTFPIEVNDPSIVGLIITVYWRGHDTNIDLAVAGKGSPLFLAGPPDIEYYGTIIAAKLSLFLYRSGWAVFFDRPAPRMTTIYVPVNYMGTYWIIIRNTLIDASKYYPENIKIMITPVRISQNPIMIQLSNGEGETKVKLWGSYALSHAALVPIPVSGSAFINITPQILGVGNEHYINIHVKSTSQATYKLAIILDGYSQYSIGVTIAGLKFSMEYPAIIYIPIIIKT